jgi:hypothetical protein
MRGVWDGSAESATPNDKRPDLTPLTLLPTSSRAKRRKSFTVHVGSAGRITLASRDNEAAGTHRPATLRVGTRGSVLRIGTGGRASVADKSAPAAPSSPPAAPPIPPE